MGQAVITSTSAILPATAMASRPGMRAVLSAPPAACLALVAACAMCGPPRPGRSALLGDGQHLRELLLVLPPDAEAVRALGAVGDPLQHPALVGLGVLAPRLPLAGVVAELRVVHHGDALGLRA